MLLMILNIFLVVAVILSIWISRTVPGIFAILCGIVGGFTIYSRYLAWKMGAAQHGYRLVQDDEQATKQMKNIESLFWATGVFNFAIFLWYVLK